MSDPPDDNVADLCPQGQSVSTDTIRLYGTVLYAFGWIFTLLCYVPYILALKSRRFARLRSRHPMLTHAMCAGALLHLQVDPLALMLGRESYKCGAVVLQFLVIPLLGGPVVARLLSFYFRSKFESLAMRTFRQSLRSREDVVRSQQSKLSGSISMHEDEMGRRLSATGIMKAFTHGFIDAFFFCMKSPTIAMRASSANLLAPSKDPNELSLRKLRFLQSGHGIAFVIFALFMVPAFFAAVGVAITEPAIGAGCIGCKVPLSVSSFLLVQGGAISIMTLILLFRIRQGRMPDKWGVVTETLLCVVFAAIGMLGYALMNHVNTGKNWDFTFLLSFGIWGMVFVQTALQLYLAITRDRIQVARSRRAFQQSISAATLNSAHYNLNVVLADKALAKAFEDHLQREFGVESLFFYQEAKTWKMSFPDMSPNTRISRAKKIIQTFIQPDAIFWVNIPSATSRAIFNAMENRETFPQPELFDDALDEVRDLLEMGALARFRKTDTFKNIIAEGLQHITPLAF